MLHHRNDRIFCLRLLPIYIIWSLYIGRKVVAYVSIQYLHDVGRSIEEQMLELSLFCWRRVSRKGGKPCKEANNWKWASHTQYEVSACRRVNCNTRLLQYQCSRQKCQREEWWLSTGNAVPRVEQAQSIKWSVKRRSEQEIAWGALTEPCSVGFGNRLTAAAMHRIGLGWKMPVPGASRCALPLKVSPLSLP